MKRSISTLLTTLLFSAAIVPNAMAQMQEPSFPVSLSVGSTSSPEQPMSDVTQPAPTKTEGLSEPSKSQTSSVSANNAERAYPNGNASYPAYCPFLPAGTKPGDWEYREALEKCLHGT